MAAASGFDTAPAFWGIYFLTGCGTFIVPHIFVRVWLSKKIMSFDEEYKLRVDPELQKLESTDCHKANGSALLAEIAKRGNMSLRILGDFTEYHYFALMGAILAAVLSGAAAFLLAADGWNKANMALQGMFLGSASALAPEFDTKRPFWVFSDRRPYWNQQLSRVALIFL